MVLPPCFVGAIPVKAGIQEDSKADARITGRNIPLCYSLTLTLS